MTQQTSIAYLDRQCLEGFNISTAQVIQSIEKLILQTHHNQAWSAPKAVVMPPDRYLMATLAATNEPPLLAVKALVLNQQNRHQGLAAINALVMLLNSQTGLPLAIMDGNWITAVRTAGLSAVAAKYLAKADSNSIGFIGCGVQAESHLQALNEGFPINKVFLFGRSQSSIDKLSQSANQLGLESIICDHPKQTLEKADLVVSSVTYDPNLNPFLDANWLKKDSFSSITDLAAPWHKLSFGSFDQLIIDDCQQEASLTNKLADPEHIHGDLAQLVLGKLTPSTKSKNAFVFRGHALGDLALVTLVYERALETNSIAS